MHKKENVLRDKFRDVNFIIFFNYLINCESVLSNRLS